MCKIHIKPSLVKIFSKEKKFFPGGQACALQLNVVKQRSASTNLRGDAERREERTYVLPLSGVAHRLCGGGRSAPPQALRAWLGFPSECSPAPTKPVWPPLSARSVVYGRLACSSPSHSRPRTQQFPNCLFITVPHLVLHVSLCAFKSAWCGVASGEPATLLFYYFTHTVW